MTRSPYRDDSHAQTLPGISVPFSLCRTTSATFSPLAVYSFLHCYNVACKFAADGMNVKAEPRLQRSNRGGYRSQDVMSLSQLLPAPLVFLSLDRENYFSPPSHRHPFAPTSRCSTSLCFQFRELDIALPASSSLRPAAPSCFRCFDRELDVSGCKGGSQTSSDSFT
jgi:hypothetical protein